MNAQALCLLPLFGASSLSNAWSFLGDSKQMIPSALIKKQLQYFCFQQFPHVQPPTWTQFITPFIFLWLNEWSSEVEARSRPVLDWCSDVLCALSGCSWSFSRATFLQRQKFESIYLLFQAGIINVNGGLVGGSDQNLQPGKGEQVCHFPRRQFAAVRWLSGLFWW